MNIPSTFTLFGSTHTVVINNSLRPLQECEGRYSYRLKLVELMPVGEDQTREAQEHALLHEVVHAILTQMGENKLNDDEKFVDIFAGLWHQYIKTSSKEII